SNHFNSLQSYVQNGNYDQAIQTLKRWLARTKNEQIQKSLTGLLQALEKEQAARLAKLSDQVDQVLARAARDVATSKTSEEATRIQNHLAEFRAFNLNSGDRSSSRLSNRVNLAIQFINLWQPMLVAEEMGDIRSALQNLDNLRRKTSSHPP